MDILEELRKQKETQHNNPESPNSLAGELNAYQHSILLGRLRQIHDYLHELSSHLNQLNYTTTAEMQIPGFGAITNLHQSNYELVWENRGAENRVVLNFSTDINDSCPLHHGQENNDEIITSLKQNGIAYTTNENEISLSGNINSSISFGISPEEHDIQLTVTNFKQIGQYQYSIDEKLINENFFDQLGRFLLQRENNLIELVQTQKSDRIDQEDDQYDDQDSAVNTQEMDVSRVRSLFNKEVQLYLTYHNAIKEITPKSNDFIIGRSKQNNIVVNSDLASRHHAKIVYRKGKYVLIDQSTNGTFVKTQGGKEVYVQGEELPLSGSGFISLGKSVTVDNEHIIYFSCQ